MGGKNSGPRKRKPFKPAPKIKLYERQPNESDPAFEAFKIYKNLGAERSQAKVAKTLGKSAALMDRWSSRWGWRDRVAAWDHEVDQYETRGELKAIEEMRKRHAKQAMLMQGVGSLAANKYLKLEQEKAGPILTPDQVHKFVEAGTKLERTARGEVDKTGVEVSGPDGQPIQKVITVKFVSAKK